MYHGAGYRKLGKKTNHRLAMFSNMANSLIEHGRIQTTLPKAKDLKRVVERLVTKGKQGGLHKRRQVASFLRNDIRVKQLFDEVAPRFQDRKGGYLRVLKLAETRHGDAATQAIIEFVDYTLSPEKTKEDRKKEKIDAKAKAKEAKKAKAKDPRQKSAKDLTRGGAMGRKTSKAGAASTTKGSGSRGT